MKKFQQRCEAARSKQDRLRGVDRRSFVPSEKFKRRTTSVDHLETFNAAARIASDEALPQG